MSTLLLLLLLLSFTRDVISSNDHASMDAMLSASTHMRRCVGGFEALQKECLNMIVGIPGYCCLYFTELVHRGCICPLQEHTDLPMYHHGVPGMVLTRLFVVCEIPDRDRCYVSDFASDEGWERLATSGTGRQQQGGNGPPALGGGDATEGEEMNADGEVKADGEEVKAAAAEGSQGCFGYMVSNCKLHTSLIVIAGILLGGVKWVLGFLWSLLSIKVVWGKLARKESGGANNPSLPPLADLEYNPDHEHEN